MTPVEVIIVAACLFTGLSVASAWKLRLARARRRRMIQRRLGWTR